MNSLYRVNIILLCLLLFATLTTDAQVTDTLKEVQVKDKAPEKPSIEERLNIYSPGQHIVTIDSITLEQYKFQSIANLLSQQVPVFVKSYGLNNIATLNFRGASAAQSQVYWNGIPIQNAALGISDVSLLPVEIMNRVNVVYGSSSALWGSGNVGGALLVENNLPAFTDSIETKYSASAVAGSFNHYRFGLKSSLSTRKFSLGINAFGQAIQNNFSYTDKGQSLKMNNAGLASGVGLLQAGYKVNERNTLDFKAWYQQYYREIPRALFESNSVKNQRDESLRLLTSWNRKGDKADYYIKTSYIQDFMWYRDSAVLLESKNNTHQVYTEAGVNYTFSLQHKLLVFAPVQVAWMERQNIGDIISQERYAIAAAYLFRDKQAKLNLSLNGRAETVNGQFYFLPGINAAYKLTNWLTLKGNVQRTYRVPTLNELYHNPGGNEKLKPEQGWNEDVGYRIAKEGRLNITHTLSVFNRNIQDWIIWFGGAIWTPHNIATVQSRGLETENRFVCNFNDIKLHLGINATYVSATTIETYLPADGSIGKQIPYTPKYQGQNNAGFSFNGWRFNYNITYTGLRYVTIDESLALPSYTLHNLQLMYSKGFNDVYLQVVGQVNNIFNTNYRVVNARPMPGVNGLIGISLSYR